LEFLAPECFFPRDRGRRNADNPTLLDADLKMIKDTIGNAYPPSIVHKLWLMLDQLPPNK
jgi:hypothetical protein